MKKKVWRQRESIAKGVCLCAWPLKTANKKRWWRQKVLGRKADNSPLYAIIIYFDSVNWTLAYPSSFAFRKTTHTHTLTHSHTWKAGEDNTI